MDVQVIRRPHHVSHVPDLGHLISELGDVDFPDRLFSEVRKLCGCAHFVALASDQHEPIKVIFATNEGPARLAHATAEKYIADHWRYDPVNALLPKLQSADVSVRTTPRDIGSGQYRRDCYSQPKLSERLSLLRRRNGITSRLHLYRADGTASFSERELDAVAGLSEVLFALVAKHSEIARVHTNTPADLRQCLLMMAPEMPRRELDVCIGIAHGQTSEAIALSLGISANTVLTYRKRAYTRLRITSANELLARIYADGSAKTRARTL